MAPCEAFRPCLQNLAAQITRCSFACAGPSSSPTAQGLGLADSNTGSSHIFHLLDFSPEWDFTAGGVKMLVTGTLGADSDSFCSMHIMFDQQEVRQMHCRGEACCTAFMMVATCAHNALWWWDAAGPICGIHGASQAFHECAVAE